MASKKLVISPPSGGGKKPTAYTLENPEVPIYDNRNTPEPTFGADVSVREVSMTLNNGAKIDLRGYFESVIIEESMFNTKVSGSVIINDLIGALEKFEIRGGERLNLKIYKPESEDILIWREDFIINKVNKHEIDVTSGSGKYQLMFTSNSFVRSIKKTIYKSFKNTPLLYAVRSLYSEMSANDLMVEDPEITLTEPFICTGIPPHVAIDALAQRSSGPLKYYVFFERFVPVTGQYVSPNEIGGGQSFSGSHYFGSVEQLIESTDETGIKVLTFGNKTDANVEKANIVRVSKLVKESNFNHLESTLLGLHKTKFTYLDLKNRTTTNKTISYGDKTFFDDVSGDFYNNSFLTPENKFFQGGLSETGTRKLTTANNFGTKKKEEWLPYNIFGMLTKNYLKLSAIVQGGTNNISVGNVVQLNVISYFEKVANASSGTPPLDEIYSGRYYVTGVTHVITQEKYQKTLEISRGSSRKEFYTEADTLIRKIELAYPNLAKLFIR